MTVTDHSALRRWATRFAPGLAGLAILALVGAVPAPVTALLDEEPGGLRRISGGTQEDGYQGSWRLQDRGARVYIDLESDRGRNHFGTTLSADELTGFDQLGAGRFELRRDAGTFVFDASSSSDSRNRWRGRFQFLLDEGYVSDMVAAGFSEREIRREGPSLAMLDVSREYVREMAGLGYDESLRRLTEMRIHGVTAEYVMAMDDLGLSDLSASKLVEMRIHGVTPEFVEELADLGYVDLRPGRLVELRIHGVETDDIQRRIEAGDSHPSLSRLVEYQIHGVTPEFQAEMAELGYDRLDEDDLVAFRIHGVTPEFVREMEELGYRRLDEDDLLGFRIHGVDARFVRELADLGYGDLDADDLVAFRIHGVTPELIEELADRGMTGLTADELLDIRIHGFDRVVMRRR